MNNNGMINNNNKIKGEDNMKLEVLSVLDEQIDINKGEIEMNNDNIKVYDLLKMTGGDFIGTLKTLFTRNFNTDKEKSIIEYAVETSCRKMSSIKYGDKKIGVSYKIGKTLIDISSENTDKYDPIADTMLFYTLREEINEIIKDKKNEIKINALKISYNENIKALNIESPITQIQIINIERKEILIGVYGIGDVFDSAESISNWLCQN